MTEKRYALVTGAGGRLGQAIAIDLGKAGYDVAVHFNKSKQGAEETLAAIREAGGQGMAFQADLAKDAEVEGLIGRVAAEMGPVSLLVNNASIFEPDLWDTASRGSWDRHMDANLRAPFVLMQSFAKALPEGMDGAIVNMIDQRVWNLSPNYISYTLSKSGLWTLTRTMALALAPKIRVNAIGPGPTLPNPQQDIKDFEDECRAIPLQRRTGIGEICDAVRFLAKTPSMTGQMLALDGGEHLGWAQAASGFVPNE